MLEVLANLYDRFFRQINNFQAMFSKIVFLSRSDAEKFVLIHDFRYLKVLGQVKH